MTSPFVRRRRLATELRTLREEAGMTTDRLAKLIHQSRMKISRLENAHIRPDLAEVMKILDILGAKGDRWHDIVRIARDAAEKGWWDAYGDTMGPRQRLYADLESGAKTIREYCQTAMPGVLQTPTSPGHSSSWTEGKAQSTTVPSGWQKPAFNDSGSFAIQRGRDTK